MKFNMGLFPNTVVKNRYPPEVWRYRANELNWSCYSFIQTRDPALASRLLMTQKCNDTLNESS